MLMTNRRTVRASAWWLGALLSVTAGLAAAAEEVKTEPAPPAAEAAVKTEPPAAEAAVKTEPATGAPADATPPIPPAPPPRVVMARVGDEEITVDQFMAHITKQPELVKYAVNNEGKARVLRQLIVDRLLKQAMQREGLLPEKASAAQTQEAFSQLARKHFPVPPPPAEEAAKQFYQTHQERYGIPETVRVSQIQFRAPPGASADDRAAVQRKAEAALERLNAGEPFAKLAGELTENPKTKANNGDLGFLPVNESPWLKQAIAGLSPGGHTGVIASPAGYEILQLTERREATISPYPQVREQVIEEMQALAQRQAMMAYLKELQKTTPVTIVMEGLENAAP